MPLYRRPEPLGPIPAYGTLPIGFFHRNVIRRTESRPQRATTRKNPLFSASLLAGAAAALFFLGGFAVTLLVASLTWTSPYRDWLLFGLSVAYLTGVLATTRVLRRRLDAWKPLEGAKLRFDEDSLGFGNLFNPVHHEQISNPHGFFGQRRAATRGLN